MSKIEVKFVYKCKYCGKKVSQLDRVRNERELLERAEDWKIKLQWLEGYCKVNDTCSFVFVDVKKPNIFDKL